MLANGVRQRAPGRSLAAWARRPSMRIFGIVASGSSAIAVLWLSAAASIMCWRNALHRSAPCPRRIIIGIEKCLAVAVALARGHLCWRKCCAAKDKETRRVSGVLAGGRAVELAEKKIENGLTAGSYGSVSAAGVLSVFSSTNTRPSSGVSSLPTSAAI